MKPTSHYLLMPFGRLANVRAPADISEDGIQYVLDDGALLQCIHGP